MTSPQAFEALRMADREVRRPDRTLATADHNVPTDGTPVASQIREALSRRQVELLETNCDEFGIPVYSLGSERQGIVHIIGPELGVTQPGMTIVCGDSHTATHGAFGALAFGIGTSEVEHVLATQTLQQPKPKSMRINYVGDAGPVRHREGHDPRARSARWGRAAPPATPSSTPAPAIEALSMEGRMTDLQHDDRGRRPRGMIAPDETTFEWLRERGVEDFDAAPWERAALRRRRDLRPRDHRRLRRAEPDRLLGHEPRAGRPASRARSRSRPASPRSAR